MFVRTLRTADLPLPDRSSLYETPRPRRRASRSPASARTRGPCAGYFRTPRALESRPFRSGTRPRPRARGSRAARPSRQPAPSEALVRGSSSRRGFLAAGTRGFDPASRCRDARATLSPTSRTPSRPRRSRCSRSCLRPVLVCVTRRKKPRQEHQSHRSNAQCPALKGATLEGPSRERQSPDERPFSEVSEPDVVDEVPGIDEFEPNLGGRGV
jgi:hypothetical protein